MSDQPQGRSADVVPPIQGELAEAIAKARAAGRWPPRVLHIGNIANNAYLNARILNEAGIPSDVLVYDYYHVMACPEWEEGDIVDMPEQFDENRLDWSSLTIRDFERPEWFSQGPFRWATRYLASRRAGDTTDARLHWHLLRFYRWLHARPSLEVQFQKVLALRFKLFSWWSWSKYWWHKIAFVIRALFFSLFWKVKSLAARTVNLIKRALLFVHRRLEYVVRGIGRRLASMAKLPSPVTVALPGTPPPEVVSPPTMRVSVIPTGPPAQEVPPAPPPLAPAPPAVDPLITRFAQLYPERADQLTAEDLIPYRGGAPSFAPLLAQYDIVVGYSTDPIWPMMTGHPCYMAFEHGTIRAIPFEQTAQGRLTALGYRTAKCAFITNCDEIRAIGQLRLDNATFVPHPMNDRLLATADGTQIRADLAKRFDTDFIIFHPARQHWEPQRNPSLEKGNDLFLKAFARFVRDVNPKALLVCVRWGKSLAETDKLLADEGVAGRVHWIKPIPNRQMLRWVAASDVVADQFWLGCFGGITPKAYSMAKPVVIYLDREIHDWCFPYMPPHIEERSDQAIFDFIARLYRDAAYMKEVSGISRDWYVKYHSEASIRDRWIKALLDRWAMPPAGLSAEPCEVRA